MITFSDNKTLTVKNGSNGEAGDDGVSPTVSKSDIDGGTKVTINYKGGSTSFDVMNGKDGAAGAIGQTGPQGDPGPNEVSTATATNITGLLKGNGSKVSAAQAGEDYEAPGTASGAVTEHNAVSDAHSDLFAEKMAAKTSYYSYYGNVTLASEHSEQFIFMESSEDATVTIPNSGIPSGTIVNVVAAGTGSVTIAAAYGVTLNTKNGARTIDGQNTAVTLYNKGGEWFALGALK